MIIGMTTRNIGNLRGCHDLSDRGEGMTIEIIMWLLVGIICGVIVGTLIVFLWALSREDKVLESLIMDMDYDVVQEWIEEEEERRRINK